MSPHAQYRGRFFRRILERAPASLLDVGCGEGALIASLVDHNIRVAGLEPDKATVDACRDRRFSVQQGTAEAMPFEDNSFDMVVSEFSLHHFADYEAAVAECLRVARRFVLFLDGWYDRTIPSQRAADGFDRWMKDIDQKCGEIHGPVLDAGQVLAAAQKAEPAVSAQTEHWLQLTPLAEDKYHELVEESLSRAPDPDDAKESLTALQQQIAQDGLSEDGALFIALTLPSSD